MWQSYHNPTAYVAGIIDAIGRLRVRVRCTTCGSRHQDWECDDHDLQAYAAVVEVRTRKAHVKDTLCRTLGGTKTSRGWFVQAYEQHRILTSIMHYLRDPQNIDTCGRIIQFRMTQVGFTGKEIQETVARLRQRMATERDPG